MFRAWAVEERLAELENAGLDDRVLEVFAKLSTVEGLEALQELEQAVYFRRRQREIEAAMANMRRW